MKCEACLPLVDEFFDGELDVRHAGDVRTHIKRCTSCSGYYDSLRIGQDVYDKFLEDVKLSPAAWQGVRQRIHEKETASAGFFEKLNWLVVPRFVAAALAIAVVAVVVFRFATHVADKPQVAVVTPDRVESPSAPTPSVSPQLAIEQPHTVTHSRAVSRRQTQTAATFEKAAAFGREMESARVELEANRPVTLQTDVARHFEKTRLLLLSLKNASVADTDVSYEKTVSRKLAGNNLLLRRETTAAGDRSAAELLDRIEPLLIDIANMPDRVSAEEVASMSRRIARKDVLGLLQSQTF